MRGSVFAQVTVLLLAYLLIGWWVSRSQGDIGWLAAGVAAVICGISSTSALLLTGLVRNPQSSVAVLFGSILIRTTIPLAAGLVVSARGGPLKDAGFFGLIVAFYLVTLAAETALSLNLINGSRTATEAEGHG